LIISPLLVFNPSLNLVTYAMYVAMAEASLSVNSGSPSSSAIIPL